MTESTIIQRLTFNKAITDVEFAKEIFRKLPFDSFDTEAEKVLAKEINRYYLTNDKTMTEKTLKMYIEGRLDEGLDQGRAEEVINLIEDAYAVTTELDEEVAIEELDRHIRRSLTLKTLKEFISRDELDDEAALEELGKEITGISLLDSVNSGDENFLDLFNDTERKIELYKNLRTKTHPTGYTNIDSMLDGGGLGRGEVALLIAGTGQGKALVNGTKVITPRGEVPIEQLKEGDKAFGLDGKPHNVVGVFPQGKREVYEITFSNGEKIRNNDEHIWTYREVGSDDDYVTSTLRELMEEYQGKDLELPKMRPVHHPTKELKITPYTMGVLLRGDDSLGVKREFPREYLRASVEQRIGMLEGVTHSEELEQQNEVEVGFRTKELAEGVRELAGSLGIHADVQVRNGRFRLTLKPDKPLEIVSVKRLGYREDMTCISVDAPDKLFIIEGYIPTHNTSIAVQTATNYVNQGMNVLYVTLEEKLERIAVRLESNLLGAHMTDFYDEYEMINEDLIRAAGESYRSSDELGNLYISKHSPREVSVEKLEQILIQTKLRKGLDVDFVVIDYPALMSVPGKNKIHEEQGELFERIRGLAQKYNFIALTLAQTNRTAWSADVVTLNNIEGGFMVANACELVLTVNRTQEEYEEGFFRMHVDKVRNRSTKPIPNMLSFTVDSKGYRMRASSPQEQDKHFNILKQAGREDDVDGFAKANDTVNNINEQLKGGF